MSMICKNGSVHKHETVFESKLCWGIIKPPPSPTPPAPVVRYATGPQLKLVGDLNGDKLYAAKLTVPKCSEYIDQLKAARKEAPKVDATPDPRLRMVEGLITQIPDGYYAVQRDAGEAITFLRISRPKPTSRSRYAGALKIQTQHGPRLQDDAVQWPSGRWSFYNYGEGWMLDKLLLLCSDHFSAALRYAHKLNHCMRCNTELTDDRSRHYGIGPECETKNGWGWVIDRTDDMHDGLSFETLRARGLINL